jgi:4'-phosphopantetheinyl transferase
MTAQALMARRDSPVAGHVAETHGVLDGVELWSARVDAPERLGDLPGELDDDEQARAARFRFERDRIRFVARRAFLRSVLAGYLGVPSGMIRYRTSAAGRPELEPRCGVVFSTSHADGLAIVAVARERLVGVDVERVRPIPGAAELARHFYTRAEDEYVASVPEAARSEAFLRLWTRKESYVKALGAGMSMPFDRFNVLDGGTGRASRDRTPDGRQLAFATLDKFAGYVGSVAASRPAATPDERACGAGRS